MPYHDPERVRGIIKIAAHGAPSAKNWLLRDEFGTWEKTVREYLDRAAEHPRVAELTAEEIDAEVASVVALLALEALLRDAQKSVARPKRSRRRRA